MTYFEEDFPVLKIVKGVVYLDDKKLETVHNYTIESKWPNSAILTLKLSVRV